MLEHPNHVLAISTTRVDACLSDHHPDGPIVCVGTFSVERTTDDEARFTFTHVTFDPDEDWRSPGAHVRCLLHRHSYAIGFRPTVNEGREMHRRQRLPSYDELPGTAHLPPLQRHVIRGRERSLARIGREHGLMVSDRPPHLLQAKREAAERAMAIWLTCIGFVRDRDERAKLFAAWEAWRVLERLRPLPF